MCRLLGIKHFDFEKHGELLENFAALAETGKVLNKENPGHNDGWGIGYYRDGKASVYKSGNSIAKERKTYLKKLEDIAHSPVLIAHLRKSAWPGTTSAPNSHPFEYKNLMLAHNGTIRDYEKLFEKISPGNKPGHNALDTEVLLRFVSNSLSADIQNAFKESAAYIIKNNSYTSLNCIFSDGKKLCAYREYAKNPRYYSLYHAQAGNSRIISSEPLSQGLEWKLLGKRELFIA